MSRKKHPLYPFDSGYDYDNPLMTCSVADRLQRVKNFNLQECEAALVNNSIGLQKTVRLAVECRIRKLKRADIKKERSQIAAMQAAVLNPFPHSKDKRA